MSIASLAPHLPSLASSVAADHASTALARAVERRDRRDADLDGALSLFVRRARAHDEPIERMLVRLKQLLRTHVHPLRADDDPHEVVALVMRRAITAFYRED